MEPIIEKGHEWLVHHIILYACDMELDEATVNEAHGYHGSCNMWERGHTMDRCSRSVYAWAVGGGVRCVLHKVYIIYYCSLFDTQMVVKPYDAFQIEILAA